MTYFLPDSIKEPKIKESLTYCLFDFGEKLKIKESFSEIEINGIPIRESYDENRVGYQRKNTKSLNFNISRIRLMKIIKNKEELDRFEKFYLYYMVMLDMPLEFKLFYSYEKDSISIKNIHGFIEKINLKQNSEENFFRMEISLLNYE